MSRPTEELREKADWHVDQGDVQSLRDMLDAAFEVMDNNYELYDDLRESTTGRVTHTELHGAYAKQQLCIEIAKAVDRAADLTSSEGEEATNEGESK